MTVLRDTWLVFVREIGQRRRQSFWLVVGLIQPLLYLYLYGPLVTKLLAGGHASIQSWSIFAPALLLQTALTQGMFVGLGLLVEYRAGVFDRLRVIPIHRAALLLGKLMNIGVTVGILSALIIVQCRLFFGLPAPAAGLVVCVMFTVLVSVALASYSYVFALLTKNEQALATVLNTALLPLLLLSGAFLPISEASAPSWLFWMSRLNPMAYVMDASRAVLRGEFFSGVALSGEAVLLAMTAFGVGIAVRTFSRDHG